jgi:DNA-binding CsgD family transcriptional regulator
MDGEPIPFDGPASLSQAEYEILAAYRDTRSRAAAAHELGITEDALRGRLERIRRKLEDITGEPVESTWHAVWIVFVEKAA